MHGSGQMSGRAQGVISAAGQENQDRRQKKITHAVPIVAAIWLAPVESPKPIHEAAVEPQMDMLSRQTESPTSFGDGAFVLSAKHYAGEGWLSPPKPGARPGSGLITCCTSPLGLPGGGPRGGRGGSSSPAMIMRMSLASRVSRSSRACAMRCMVSL